MRLSAAGYARQRTDPLSAFCHGALQALRNLPAPNQAEVTMHKPTTQTPDKSPVKTQQEVQLPAATNTVPPTYQEDQDSRINKDRDAGFNKDPRPAHQDGNPLPLRDPQENREPLKQEPRKS